MSNANFFETARNRFRTGVAEVDRKWGWYFALGAFLILLGVIAAGMALVTTLLSVVVLGWILIGAGAGLAVLSFLIGKWSGFLLASAGAILSIIAGLAMLSYPVSGAVAITLMFGAMLVAIGIYRSVASIVMQFPNWGWSLVSGIVDLALGFILVRNWQTTSLYFLGLVVGIDLILHGFAWIMFSLRLHSLAGELGITEEGRRAA
jgi:uncharacterized membrane protein HdeD (DUF308 family)